jgi:very-short-patch-repair endonuclease
MEIFSSMSFSDIMEDETSSRGVKSLRGMLHYAETRKLQLERPSGREPDSDFEIAVSQMLSEHGFECDCQVGVSGFFIDLAVKCPQHPGRYLMGIECDGATYHSAKSARDRDRLRQEILESMGWKIRRIWSTDWFANPHKALKVIISELHLLSGGAGSSARAADTAAHPPLIDTPSA